MSGAPDEPGHRTTLLTVDVEPDWGVATGPRQPCEGLARALPLLLEELERRGVRATFFVVGELAEDFARHVDARSGHEVGAHGFTHRRLSRLTPLEREHEVRAARAQLLGAGFAVDGFRAPFLDAPPGLHALLARAGYRYDASGGSSWPSLRNRSRRVGAAIGAVTGDGNCDGDVARVAPASLRLPGVPANLTWLRLLDPAGLALLPDVPAQLSLHLHELLPATRGLASLPWPLSRLHARSCGPRAWELLRASLDRVHDAGGRFATCRETLRAAVRPVSAA